MVDVMVRHPPKLVWVNRKKKNLPCPVVILASIVFPWHTSGLQPRIGELCHGKEERVPKKGDTIPHSWLGRCHESLPLDTRELGFSRSSASPFAVVESLSWPYICRELGIDCDMVMVSVDF